MIPELAAFASGLGLGAASAVFPLVNAEAATVVAAALPDRLAGLAGVLGIALGQTAGKMVIYEAARAGKNLARSKRGRGQVEAGLRAEEAAGPVPPASRAAEPASRADQPASRPAEPASRADQPASRAAEPASRAAEPASGDGLAHRDGARPAPPAWRSRAARLSARLLAAMRGRWPCAGVVLASAGIGLPPLLVTAAAAGAVRMRRIDFALTVALGRTARFMAIAWPVMALRP